MRLFALLCGMAFLGFALGQEAGDIEAKPVSVSVFKNGYALMTQRVECEAGRQWRLVNLALPVHGTFWVETDTEFELRAGMEKVPQPPRKFDISGLISALAGKEVTIYLKEKAIVRGRIVSTDKVGQFVGVETEKGIQFIRVDQIVRVAGGMKAGDLRVVQEKPVLRIRLKGQGRHTVLIHYLTHGIIWAPAYRLIRKGSKAELQMQAVLRNELMDLHDVEVRLVSGFPNIKFLGVGSPLWPEGTITTFLQHLAWRPSRWRHPSVITQQAVLSNIVSPDRTLLPAGVPYHEGPDIHVRRVGQITLLKNRSVYLSLGKAEVGCRNLLLWEYPPSPGERYRLREDGRRVYLQTAWDAISFVNPFDFPLTTAPAVVVTPDGRLLGQTTCYWTDPKTECLLRVNRSLSVKVERDEQEDPAYGRRSEMINWREYVRVQKIVTLTITNSRKKEVEVVLRYTQDGTLVETDPKPAKKENLPTESSLNGRFRLTWRIRVEPGARKSIKFKYQILLR